MEENYSCHDDGYVRPYYSIRLHVVQGLLHGDEFLAVELPLRPMAGGGRRKGSYPESETRQKDFGGSQLGKIVRNIEINEYLGRTYS